MNISTYLKKDLIFLDIELTNKSYILHFIADACHKAGLVPDAAGLYEKLEQREKTMSTGIGDGIGLPHAASDQVMEPRILIIRPGVPVDFEALDHAPVTVIIALIIPEHQRMLHVRMLAAVSRLCKDSQFMESIKSAENPEKLLNDIKEIEAKMAFH